MTDRSTSFVLRLLAMIAALAGATACGAPVAAARPAGAATGGGPLGLWLGVAALAGLLAVLAILLLRAYARQRRAAAALAGKTAEAEELTVALMASEAVSGIVGNVPEAVLFRLFAASKGERRETWFVSAAAEPVLGVAADPREEFWARLTAAVAPECRGAFQSSLEAAFAKSGKWLFEGRLLSPDHGGERWFRAAAQPVPAEGGLVLDGTFTNISALKRAELAARAREKQGRLAFDSGLDAMLLITPDGQISAANPAACDLFGRPEAELAKEKILDLADPADLRMHAALAECARADGFRGELTFRRRDRSLFPGQVTLQPGTGQAAESAELWCLVIRDLSGRQRLERELAAAQTAAQNARHAKAEFLASMSHELRTPLNGVLGMLQLLENTPLTAEQKGWLAAAKTAGWSQLTLIGDILNLADIEAGKVQLREAEVAPRALLEEVRAALQDQAREKGLDFKCAPLPMLAETVRIDKTQLLRIMLSLAGNAIKFTEHGGVSVTLDSRPGPAPGRVRLILTVADSGIGMSAEMKGKLFTPFNRPHDSYRCGYQGSGLGLSIVKQLADRMGGTVRVDSTEGVGTTLTVEFEAPVAQSVAPPEAVDAGGGAPRRPTTTGRPLSILVVEDNEINRFVLCHFLEKSGHTVLAAVDGYEAMVRFRADSFDLILMDIQLPCMDGLEATRLIRADPRGARVPIVAVTSYAMASDQAAFLEAGMTECLTKPLDMKRLGALLARVADGTLPTPGAGSALR